MAFVDGKSHGFSDELVARLKKFVGGWKSCDPKKTNVIGELRRVLTK